jgi:hypothetical protein
MLLGPCVFANISTSSALSNFRLALSSQRMLQPMQMLRVFFSLWLAVAVARSDAQHSAGVFKGDVVTIMLADGRNLKLLQPFGYTDPRGREWNVPAGIETDGASVPLVFWITHPPFTGKYRRAAVIHDYFCQSEIRSWQDTHNVFYDAMITEGVETSTATVMWSAVYALGPRWGIAVRVRGPAAERYATDDQQKQLMDRLEAWILRDNPSRDEIAKAIDDGRILQ